MGDKSDSSSAASPRKPLKFTPKVPSHKMSKPAIAKVEPPDNTNNIIDSQLLKSLKTRESIGRRGAKVPRKSERLQVAFGYEDRSIARSFGIPKGSMNGSKDQGLMSTPTSSADGDIAIDPLSKRKEIEPWDKDSYYPVTLPLRRPNGISQEILNEEEFGGKPAKSAESSRTSTNPAEKLGLMEGNEDAQMLFFQLPASLPLENRSSNARTEKDIESRRISVLGSLQELPAGYIGKMLVYKSGAVKLKMGDILFDVSPGVDCIFAQDVAAINTKEKHCCILGNLEKRAVVTPDVDSLLNAMRKSN